MKEKILISACLLGEKVRYDGKGTPVSEMEQLQEKFDLIPLCPEVQGGLPVPRDPAEIRNGLVLTREGKDVTDSFRKGAQMTLACCQESGITRAILKARSPSCGRDLIYDGSHSGRLTEGHGLTCALLLENNIQVYTENDIGGLLK